MSTNVQFVPATADDVRRFIPLARAEHRGEIEAMGGDVDTLMRKTFAMSAEAWAVTFDGEPAVLFGVIPISLLQGYGSPWVLTTPVIERHRKTFYRLSREVVTRLREHYPMLGSSIYHKFGKSLRWARKLGFEVKDPHPCGVHGELFHQVIMGGV